MNCRRERVAELKHDINSTSEKIQISEDRFLLRTVVKVKRDCEIFYLLHGRQQSCRHFLERIIFFIFAKTLFWNQLLSRVVGCRLVNKLWNSFKKTFQQILKLIKGLLLEDPLNSVIDSFLCFYFQEVSKGAEPAQVTKTQSSCAIL